jgi:hypothetical protein
VSAPLPAELSAVLDAITPMKRTANRGAANRGAANRGAANRGTASRGAANRGPRKAPR